MSAKTKLRIMLSTELLEAITSSADSEITKHKDEISRVIIPALTRVGLGVTSTYTTKELTLEQKVNKGIATAEEIAEFEKQLMNSI